MNPYIFALAALLLLSPRAGMTQINDCAGAVVLCTSEPVGFNPIGPGQNDFADPDNDPGCIVALEQNSAWYYFQIDPTAPPNLVLGFTITPLGGFGEDYDWALYGPDVECGDLGSPIRCSSASGQCQFCPDTGMGMGAMDITEGPGTGDGFVMTMVVQPGQGFFLMIDNWLGSNNGFVMTWTGSAADYLNCEATPPCVLVALAGDDIEACEGDLTLMLDGSATGAHGGETYSWSGTNGGTDWLSDPNSPDPTIDLPPGFTGTITYTLVVEEDTCMAEDQVVLIVNPLPVATITPAGPFCQNALPQTLVAMPGGGVWGGAAEGNSFVPSAHDPGIHTVTYTYTDGNGCSVTAYEDIEVWATPDVTADPDPAEFCESEGGILLTATPTGGNGSVSYAWQTPSGTGDGSTYLATLSGLHTIIVTDDNGCTGTYAATVIAHPDPVIEIDDPGPLCETLESITLSAIPSGGYWDGDEVDPTGVFHPLMVGPGTYSAVYAYVDEFGCEDADLFEITVFPAPHAFPFNNGPVCEGQPILLSGETDGLGTTITWSWTGPNGFVSSEQNPVNATSGGIYVLEVAVDGCYSLPATTTVDIISAPVAEAANGGPYCSGEAIELFGSSNATGPNVAFSWSGPNGYASSAQNPTDATDPGIYTLTVTSGTCPSVNAQTEVIFGTPPDAVPANTGPYCEGEAIVLTGTTSASGGVITYAWTGPNGYQSAEQNPVNATEPGAYQLIVSVDGCLSLPATTDVIVHPAPQPVIAGPNTLCAGASTVLDGGTGYITYAWSDGSAGQTLPASATGQYALTVTDGNGCSGADTIMVIQLPAIVPVISGTPDFCAGSATSLDAGTGYSAYAWSTGEMTPSIAVTASGTYGLTVTDTHGCTGTAAVVATAHPVPVVMITGSTTYCIGGYTILDAGPGYSAYQWSDGSNAQTLTVASPGTYTVSVADTRGCTGSAMVTVTESTSLSPVITGLPAFCAGGSTLLDAGAGFATYAWSDGSAAQTLAVSTAGTYTVSVSDGQGCSGTAEVAVAEIQPPSATLQPAATVCNTSAGGSVLDLYNLIVAGDINGTWVDADLSGATGPFTALDFTNVSAGMYRFTYTTNSAVAPCPEAVYEVVVTVLDCACPDVVFGAAGPLCNEGDVLDLSTVVQSAEPGTWSIAQAPTGTNPAMLVGNTFNSSGADPGDYTLQFSLVNAPPPGCPADYTLVVHVDDAVNAGMASAPLQYCADEVAVVQLADLIIGEDAGGLWTEVSAIPTTGGAFNAANGTFAVVGQSPGTYAFAYALSSSGACPGKSSTVAVVIEPLPVAVIAVPDVLDCANPMLRLDATGSSFGPDFDIAWSGPGIVIDGNEATLRPTVDQAGDYQLTVTHRPTGCLAMASVTVTAMTDPPTSALIEHQDPSCFGTVDGLLAVLAVDGGMPPFQYSLDAGPWSSTGTFASLPAGDHALLLEDANGCRWDTMIVLVEPGAISIDLGPDLEIGLGDSASVQATVVLSASPMDTILWSPANIVYCQDASCLQVGILAANSGPLQATLIDENGCMATDRILITIDKDRRIFIPNVFSPNGDGINDKFAVTGDPKQVDHVKTLRIFDRWGSEVFAADGFSLNAPDVFWDGRFHGEAMNPGVYVYYAEIEFVDGVTEAYRGDVTMLR